MKRIATIWAIEAELKRIGKFAAVEIANGGRKKTQ